MIKAASALLTVLCLLYLVVPASTAGLWGTWSPQTGGFSINALDPKTAQKGQQIYSSQMLAEFFAISPTIDYAKQRVYLTSFVPSQTHDTAGGLLGWDLSNPNSKNVTLLLKVTLPNSYIMAALYDAAKESVWIISAPLRAAKGAAAEVTLGYVDLASKSYKNVTLLPPGVVPFGGGLGGGPAVLVPSTRSLVMGTMDPSKSQQPSITIYNLDTGKCVTTVLDTYRILSLGLNTKTNKIYAIVATIAAPGNISFASVDTSAPTPSLNILHTWSDPNLHFVVGALAALDSVNDVYYSVMGSGFGPPVALVSIDMNTGIRKNAVYFTQQEGQPQSIFYL